MIISIDELKSYNDLSNIPDAELTTMAEGIEDFITKYTNNSFVVRNTSFVTPSTGGRLDTVSPLMRVGDTVLITNSHYNDGIYTITDTDGTLNKDVLDDEYNKVTLVRYPPSIKLGVIKLLQYNVKMDSKVGISSESISRHSVSYAQPSSDSVCGYPSSLMSFLKPYMKARF